MITLKNLNEYPSTSFLSLKDLLDEVELNGGVLSELAKNTFYIDVESLIKAHDNSVMGHWRRPGALREYITNMDLTDKIKFNLKMTVEKNILSPFEERSCFFYFYTKSGRNHLTTLGILVEQLSNIRVLT